MKSASLSGEDSAQKRAELRAYFHQSFDCFEALFELLETDEVYYRQSEPTRHPMIFYFGHTAVFYINKLILSGVLSERINPAFESMFAVGVDEMMWDEESGRFSWPRVEAVREYRNRVRSVVDTCIQTMPMTLPVTQDSPFWAIWMGIEHERIHIETSSVLHRQMPLEYVRPHPDFPRCPDSAEAPQNSLIPVPGGKIAIGKGEDDHGLYGWDNEYGRETFTVEPFEASRYLVSNGEFLPFVEAGGYQNQRWWDEEGRKYLSIRRALCPPFWIPQGDGTYRYRVLAEEIPMPYNWPVEVNALEAQAFCRWKSERENDSFRLPSEAEWYTMLREGGMDGAVFDDERANVNLAHYASSVPVDRYRHGQLYDVVGNVWQWSQSAIDGFEGFKPHPWYDDFSTPTFDGKHNLIKGGSWISTGNEIVASSRYAFRRHFVQHAGFRYIRGGSGTDHADASIVEDEDVSLLCAQGYGNANTFAVRAVEAMMPYFARKESALELGCGAGRLTLELSRIFESVTGMDRSARFIAPVSELLQEGKFRYRRGETLSEVSLESLNLSGEREKVRFFQGDIYNLKLHVRGYDTIIVNTLHEPLKEKEKVIRSLVERLNEGGNILVLSDYPFESESMAFEYLLDGKEQQGYLTVAKRSV